MHSGVLAAGLQENMITVMRPSSREGCFNDGPSVAFAAKFGMRDDILEKSMRSAGTQQVWGYDERAGCDDPGVRY